MTKVRDIIIPDRPVHFSIKHTHHLEARPCTDEEAKAAGPLKTVQLADGKQALFSKTASDPAKHQTGVTIMPEEIRDFLENHIRPHGGIWMTHWHQAAVVLLRIATERHCTPDCWTEVTAHGHDDLTAHIKQVHRLGVQTHAASELPKGQSPGTPPKRSGWDHDWLTGQSIWGSKVNGRALPLRHNLRTTGADWRSELDWETAIMGGSLNAGVSGTSTGTSATTLTDTLASFVTTSNGYNGHRVYAGTAANQAYGTVLSNTATALTIDRWNSLSNPGGAAATTPAAVSTYFVEAGNAPASWLALSTDATAPSAADTTLASELTSNGLQRGYWGTFAHTTGTTSFSMTKVFNCTGGTSTINKEAIFNAQNGGVMPFESAEPNPPILINGDSLTQTVTISI